MWVVFGKRSQTDVLIGAPGASNNGRRFSGSACVVFGKASTANVDLAALGAGGDRIGGAGGGTPPNPPTDFGTLGDQAGFSVAGAGDMTGDGRADVLVAAPGADNNGRSDSGSAYLVSFAAPTLKEVRRQIRDLIAVVRFFGLPRNERLALNVRLRIALAALRTGSRTTACSALNGFIVRAFIDTRGPLTRAQATFLITDAIRIRADLGCGWSPASIREVVVAVILAAGQGTRMRSEVPKPLHELCGRPLVLWPVRAALDAGIDRVVVVDGPGRAVAEVLPEEVAVAVQDEPLGTGHAVLCAAEELRGADTLVVLAGDVPLVSAEVLRGLLATHEAAGAGATMATMVLEDATGYGRVVRSPDGSVQRVVETKRPEDATPDELAIHEVNTGLLAFDAAPTLEALRDVRPDNAQGEVFLPDVLPPLAAAGRRIAAHVVDDAALTLGVNDRADLALVRAHAQRRIHERHMRAGVTIVDPGSTQIDADVDLGVDTMVEPFCFLRGVTSVGGGCRIGPLTTVVDSELGHGVSVRHSYLDSCQVLDGATVGPFAYLRPKALLREGAKVGTFVEVKNSDVGAGAKVPHLSYLGDADVGEDTNLGAGTITANYDGFRKHRTEIGARVHGGVHVSLVAPVALGDDSWTAAGSVITKEVPPGALGVARARQRNVLDYARRVEERVRADEEQRKPPAAVGGDAYTRRAE